MNNTETNIFDIKNIDDLPQKLRDILSKMSLMKGYIIELLRIQDGLSVDQLLVGLYRKHGVTIKNRQRLMNIIAKMIESGVIKTKCRGVYWLNKGEDKP